MPDNVPLTPAKRPLFRIYYNSVTQSYTLYKLEKEQLTAAFLENGWSLLLAKG